MSGAHTRRGNPDIPDPLDTDAGQYEADEQAKRLTDDELERLANTEEISVPIISDDYAAWTDREILIDIHRTITRVAGKAEEALANAAPFLEKLEKSSIFKMLGGF